MSDIRDQKSIEQDSIAAFQARYTAAALCCALVARDGRLLAANRAFGALTGHSADASTHLCDLFPDTSNCDVSVTLEAVKAGSCDASILRALISKEADASLEVDLHFMVFDPDDTQGAVFLVHCVDVSHEAELQRIAENTKRSLNKTETYVRAATEAGRVALWNICPMTGKTWFSDMWYRLLGYEPGSFEASFETFLDLMHPDDHEATVRAYTDLVEGRNDFYVCDFRLRDAQGDWRWIGATGARVGGSDADLAMLVCGMQTDVTWRKKTEANLAKSVEEAVEHRARLDQLAENSPVGLFEFRLYPDGRIEFPYISQGVLDTLGVTREEVEEDGSASFRHILPEYLEPVNEAIGISQANLTPFRFRYRLAHPQRGISWIQANSVPTRLEDQSTTWHGSVYDVTPEVQREADLAEARDQALQMKTQMEELALHDVLTGLPNRRFFDLRLQQQRALAQNAGAEGTVTLIRVDLDHFKYVNDNLGHDAGDAVLVHVGKLLSKGIRQNDFVARIGGDEFSIILGEEGGTMAARRVVGDVQKALRKPFLYGDQICRFGASFGIATCDAKAISEGELHAFADAALYEAKQKGRNRVEVFTRSLHNHIIESRRLTAEIEEALERREFEPVFQPQVCARTGQLVGLETLARWRHPTRGMLSPDDFMKVAEQIRAVPMIDQMMLEKTRDILARWRCAGFIPPKISFNVSSGRLRDPEILTSARRIQEEGTVIAIELLESILVEDENDEFRFNLDALKDSGIQIEIDDFGSGHASIIGVMEADPAVLKIDKRLSCNVAENPQARELISAIVSISTALGISTTVEGVETREQADILTELGCETLQGFYYSKPLTEPEILEFVKREATDIA